MGAILSVFLSLFGGTPSAVEARQAAGANDAAPASSIPATAPATAPATTAPPATLAPHKAVPEPEPAAVKAEGEMGTCGTHDNPADWRPYEPPPRTKECKLDAEDRAKLLEHLARIFDEETLQGRRVVFEPEDVYRLCDLVQTVLETEPMLITDVPFHMTVVGNLHGQLHDLHRVFAAEERDGKKGWENMKFLFLGDYVDRGRQSLEILMCLFSLKCLYPDRIFLLRGNHEFMMTNARHGFPLDLWDRYEEKTSHALYFRLNSTFCYLSVAAIVGDQYFCAHGGISLSGMTRRHWRGILKPYIYTQDDIVVHDTIWSDPASGLRGSSFNAERSTSHYYGLDLLCVALHSMQCKLLIRAHSMLETGYDILGSICISVCTATGMSPDHNDGAVCIIDANGKVTMRLMPADLERVAWDKQLKRMDRNAEEGTDSEPEVEEITKYEGGDLGPGCHQAMKG